MNLKSRTCCIGMLLKKLTEYGFTIQMNVKKLQISLTGMVVYEFSPLKLFILCFSLPVCAQTFSYNLQDANLLPIWSKL